MTGTILCVDDDAGILGLLDSVLRTAGYAPVAASTCGEALALAARKPDLVILDINLPDLDGIECCRRLKALDPRLPILFITAEPAGRRAEALAAGGSALFEKPFDVDELLDAVARLLARGRERRAGGDRRRRKRWCLFAGRRVRDRRGAGAAAPGRGGDAGGPADPVARSLASGGGPG